MSIGQVGPDMFSFSFGINNSKITYVVTFDFNRNIFAQLKGKVPEKAIEKLQSQNDNTMTHFKFFDRVYIKAANCQLGDDFRKNDNKIFLPLIANRIID